MGKGVEKAVQHVNGESSQALKGKDPFRQEELDRLLIELDGAENKGRLGANAILGTSLAIARGAAQAQGKWLFEYIGEMAGEKPCLLPTPMMNILNGAIPN